VRGSKLTIKVHLTIMYVLKVWVWARGNLLQAAATRCYTYRRPHDPRECKNICRFFWLVTTVEDFRVHYYSNVNPMVLWQHDRRTSMPKSLSYIHSTVSPMR
jgi:hypothetical protein